ncbi:MAG: DinB family protein [Dehalococcoidia bacterium]|nr:DinB family protein [Dehalococcoidia bacterium]
MVTVNDEIRERVNSYVRHIVSQGQASMRAAVLKGHEQLMAELDGMTDEQAAFKPKPEEWSVVEVLRHALESKRVIARRCVALAKGEQAPPVQGIGAIAGEPFSSLDKARSALADAHGELVRFVDTLSPEANVSLKEPHPWFGPLDCREWAVFERVHDGDHTNQIGQIKSATGFPAA